MRVSSTDPTLYLLEPHDVERDLLPSYVKVYETQVTEIIDWAHTYLCHSHVELGRDGPVCPYTQPSLNQELFWLTVHPGHNPTLEEVCVIVMKYREWFLELEPATGKQAQYKTILILFPDLAPAQAPDIIDTIQSQLKPEFIAQGLMIGQFHARCEEPALWSHDFRPLRSPVPLLAIRSMVPTDFPFLKKDAGWLATYLQRFEHAVPGRLQAAVHEAALGFRLEYPGLSNLATGEELRSC